MTPAIIIEDRKKLQANVHTEWSHEDQLLIDWWQQLDRNQLPTPPFQLFPGSTL